MAFVRALGLWRGAPFADLQDAPPSVRDAAAYLERQRLEAVETWNDVRLRLGRHRDLVPELSAQVVHQPYDETLHAQLMLALYRCGRQAEALDVGARAPSCGCGRTSGSIPRRRSASSIANILLQATHLDLEPPEPPGNLPASLTSFVGRARELREVMRAPRKRAGW